MKEVCPHGHAFQAAHVGQDHRRSRADHDRFGYGRRKRRQDSDRRPRQAEQRLAQGTSRAGGPVAQQSHAGVKLQHLGRSALDRLRLAAGLRGQHSAHRDADPQRIEAPTRSAASANPAGRQHAQAAQPTRNVLKDYRKEVEAMNRLHRKPLQYGLAAVIALVVVGAFWLTRTGSDAASTDNSSPSQKAATVQVTEQDGTVRQLPLVDGGDPANPIDGPAADQDPRTPVVRGGQSTKSWHELDALLGGDKQYTDCMDKAVGMDWKKDVPKFKKTEEQKTATLIILAVRTSASPDKIREVAAASGVPITKDTPIVQTESLVNTRGLEHGGCEEFLDRRPQVRALHGVVKYDGAGNPTGLMNDRGIFVNCHNGWHLPKLVGPLPKPVPTTTNGTPPPPPPTGDTPTPPPPPPPPPTTHKVPGQAPGGGTGNERHGAGPVAAPEVPKATQTGPAPAPAPPPANPVPGGTPAPPTATPLPIEPGGGNPAAPAPTCVESPTDPC
jgi:hypothetical protein